MYSKYFQHYSQLIYEKRLLEGKLRVDEKFIRFNKSKAFANETKELRFAPFTIFEIVELMSSFRMA